MVAGLDERSRRMMEDAAKNSRDRDLTELERELEASFIADLDAHQEEIKTAVLGPESAPTVLMPRETPDSSPTSQMKSPEFSDIRDPERRRPRFDLESCAASTPTASIWIWTDWRRRSARATAIHASSRGRPRKCSRPKCSRPASAAGASISTSGEAMNGAEHPTNKLQAQTNKLKPVDLAMPELEPVTMSEVGTKLDLARAYMDMGDPEGARSILEEVVQEGSASQKQEASRLIESLPG